MWDQLLLTSFILTSGISRGRRREVVLEEKVILVRRTANASKYIAPHKMVGVGAKAVDNLFRRHSQLQSAQVY